jgi:hypothetical protein
MFINKMQDAMDVEIFDSYSWLEQTDPGINLQILNAVEERI